MPETVSSNPQLRVGQYSIGFGDRASRRQTCFTQVLEPGTDNPWELDAILAVTDLAGGQDGIVPGGVVLAALQDCLWLGPSRDDDLAYLIPELIGRIDEQLRLSAHGADAGVDRTRPTITIVLVKGQRYYVTREGEAPVYLLRNNTLRPIGAESGRTHLPHLGSPTANTQLRGVRPLVYSRDEEPAVLSGALEEGDAIVVSNSDLHLLLGDRDIRLSLLQAASPRPAAVRLAEETRQRGHHYVSVGVLFVGQGPSPAHRLRPSGAVSSSSTPPAVGTPAPRGSKRSGHGRPLLWVAGAAGVMGLVAGGMIGSGLTLALHRPARVVTAAASPAPHSDPVRVDVAASPSPALPAPTAPAPPSPFAGAAPPPGLAPTAGVPRATAVSFVAPQNGASPPPSAVFAAAPLSNTPPSHTLAQGMSHKVALEILLDPSGPSLRVTSNQGALYTAAAPQGVPAGEPLTLPIPADAPVPDYRSRTELRLLDRSGIAVPAPQGAGVMKLSQGALHLPEVEPGEYRLGWWQPAIGSFQPIATLRLAGP